MDNNTLIKANNLNTNTEIMMNLLSIERLKLF
ncbi:Uncharacterised protein [Chryseobacterium carnipullorum]|uniref:Uncharacterized protein n=1 Tax=Chryseobacterium carnipullorum TaxID=1124835 RepID=A0A376DSK3_CHRCU|nr:Uncharacterised protein [Chryseobacterium carnipullorum]